MSGPFLPAANAELFYQSTRKNMYYCACTRAHIYISATDTHINTDRQRRRSFSLCLYPCGLCSELHTAADCGAAPVSWAGRLLRLGNGSTATNWAGTSPQLSLWEQSWAHLQLGPAYRVRCFCLVWLFHVLTTLGPDRGCSCMISPNWLLWHWLHCKYYISEEL